MTSNITIQFEDKTVAINQEVMQAYYENAAQFLAATDRATAQYKAEVEAFAETTGLPKGFVSKLFKLTYEDKLASEEARVEALKTLSDAINKHG